MAISIQFRDEFVGPSGVEITSRVPDEGAAWGTSENFGAGGWRTTGLGYAEPRKLSGTIKSTGWLGSNAKSYPLDCSQGLSIETTVLQTVLTSNRQMEVGLGSRDSGSKLMTVAISGTGAVLRVTALISIGGSFAVFSNFNVSINTQYRLRLEWVGSSAQFFIDDVLQQTLGTPAPCPAFVDAAPSMSWLDTSFTSVVVHQVHRVEVKALPPLPPPLDLILFRDTFTGAGEDLLLHIPDIAPWGYRWPQASGATCGPGSVSSTFANPSLVGYHNLANGVRFEVDFTVAIDGFFQATCSPVNMVAAFDSQTNSLTLGVFVSYTAGLLVLPRTIIAPGSHKVIVIASGQLAKYYLDGALLARGIVPPGLLLSFNEASSFFLSGVNPNPTQISFMEIRTFDAIQTDSEAWQHFFQTFELV